MPQAGLAAQASDTNHGALPSTVSPLRHPMRAGATVQAVPASPAPGVRGTGAVGSCPPPSNTQAGAPPPSTNGTAQSPRMLWARRSAAAEPTRLSTQPDPVGSSPSAAAGVMTVRQSSVGSEPLSPSSPGGHKRQTSWGSDMGEAGPALIRVPQGTSCWPEFRGSLAGAAQGAFAEHRMPGSMQSGSAPPARWESLHAPPAQLRGFGPPSTPQPVGAPPSLPAGVPGAAWPVPQATPTDAASEDSGEESEAAVRRAARALRLFFSGAQVRAIAAAPPGQYANIPIAGADPSKPASALAQSLRLALKLLSQDSPQGSRFRARLLLALASPNEKEPAHPGSGDPTKALSSSIEAQIFGMQGPPEEELAPFFNVASPGSQKRQHDGEAADCESPLGHIASVPGAFNFEDNLGPGLAPNLGMASVGLGSAASAVTGLGGSSSSTSLASPGGLLGSARGPVGSAWPLGAESDPSFMSFESAARNKFPDAAQELDGRGASSGPHGADGRLASTQLSGLQADLERRNPELDGAVLDIECDDGRASEDGGIASASARESEGEPAVSMRGSEASTQPPSDAAWDSTTSALQVRHQAEVAEGGFAAAAAAAVAAGSSAAGAGSTAASIRGGLQAAFHPGVQPLSSNRRHSLKEVHNSQPQSPPRRARQCFPVWNDLKDQQTPREPSAQPDNNGRRPSPHNQSAGGRANHSPTRGPSGGSSLLGPVAWSSVQCNTSVSPQRDSNNRESPVQRRGSANSRQRRAHGVASPDERVHRNVLDTQASMHKQVDVMPLRLKNLSPPRLSGLHSSSRHEASSPKEKGAVSPQVSPRGARHSSPTNNVYYRGQTAPPAATPAAVSPLPQSRDATGARTPAPARPAGSGPMVDRQGSTLRLRRDREGCQRAIAAQFQGLKESERREGSSPSPTRARPNIDFYAVGKLIGKGAFGKVNVGVHKLTEELTAMKLCERRRIAEVSARKCLMQEVSILRRLNGHPNMIQLFEVIETSTHVVLVLEFAAGGDLLRYVRQRRRLAEDNAQELFKQLIDGVGHMHMQGVVHRDVKLENLLLDSFSCLKIADFGVAVVVKPPGRKLNEHCGTPSYIAPEILLEAGYEGQPVDVWSSGVVLYAMLCGRVPFKGEHLSELKRCIVKGRFHLPHHLTDSSTALLKGMLVVDPRKRFTLGEVLRHSWMEGISNRAELIYGQPAPVYPPEAGRPEGARALPNDEGTKDILKRVAEFGFPQAFVEESLQEGKLNHATATFHLLAQQAVRKRVKVTPLASSSPPAGVATADDVPADDLN